MSRETFTVGIRCPCVGSDAAVAAEVMFRLVTEGAKGLPITHVLFKKNEIEVEIDTTMGALTHDQKASLAQYVVNVVQSGAKAGTVRGKVLGMGGWAFNSDKKDLTPEQRGKAREEILAMLAECQPHEHALVQRIADRIGKRPR